MGDLISVIVPVYNVAAYLPECLDSILTQDHAHLEVILIDDGSTDVSGAICDDYANRDSRVRVIHQKNGGGAAAKNAGLRIATGEYLSFVDSDDYLEPGAYGYMLRALKTHQTDAAEFTFRDVYRTKTEDMAFIKGQSILTGKEYLTCFTREWTCGLLWNKLYKRSLFDGIFFEEGHKIDDEYFTYQGIMNARTVLRDPHPVYHYRRRASSVMRSPRSAAQMAIDRVDAVAKRRKKVIARYPDLRRVFDLQFLEMLIYTTEFPDNTAESIAFLKDCLKDYFREPGITLPPRHFWKGLARLALTGTETLLKTYSRERTETNTEDYFP